MRLTGYTLVERSDTKAAFPILTHEPGSGFGDVRPAVLAGVVKPPGNYENCSNPCSEFTWEFTATVAIGASRSGLQVS